MKHQLGIIQGLKLEISKIMRINLVCVEDGIIAIGFRKIAAYIKSIHPNSHTFYIVLSRRTLLNMIFVREAPNDYSSYIRSLALKVANADMVCFSSMSDYAPFIHDLIREIKKINQNIYIVWGGSHAVIVPEDAIKSADAVCTGEGEFAIYEFLEKFKNGRDFTGTQNFWFRVNGNIVRNGFLPLMSSDEMDRLPLLEYSNGEEQIFTPGRGFKKLSLNDYLVFNNLGYNTIWSIGCPFKCTYCGNTKYIENDKMYQKIRHPSVDYIIREIKQAVKAQPYLMTIIFHDDSFMALRMETLEEFAYKMKTEIGLSFAVFGIIPNYVKDEKLDLLVSAGMTRTRMGIQSGSKRILDFYKRPSPPEKILKAGRILAYYGKYTTPAFYDIIVDNPIETKQDVIDTLQLLYDIPRPFTINPFSLRTMPNTVLAKQFEALEISHDDMQNSYHNLAPTMANALLYYLGFAKPPKWLFDLWIKKCEPYHVKQKHAPILNLLLRTCWMAYRGFTHIRAMEFSHKLMPGHVGILFQKLGIIQFWNKYINRKYQRRFPPIDKAYPVRSENFKEVAV